MHSLTSRIDRFYLQYSSEDVPRRGGRLCFPGGHFRPGLRCAALFITLAILTCACSPVKSETAETAEDGPLTAEELYIFNHQAFNQNNNRNGFDLNQFLLLAVEAPEDYRKIDLYQLFYNGIYNGRLCILVLPPDWRELFPSPRLFYLF